MARCSMVAYGRCQKKLRLNVGEYKIDDKNSLSSDFTLGVTKIIGFYFALERDNLTL